MNEFLTLIEADGQRFSQLITPYSHNLALSIFTVSIVWAFVTRAMEDVPENVVVMIIRRGAQFGLFWWLISNWWNLSARVTDSFQDIGQAITGVPAITPNALLQQGYTIAKTIFESSPGVMGLSTGLEFAIASVLAAFFVLFGFLVVVAYFTLIVAEIWLVVGAASLPLAFAVTPWTAPLSEGSLSYAVRAGMRLLFLYIALGVGQQILPIWSAAVTGACHPVTMSLPAIGGIPGALPRSVPTTICSTPIPLETMMTMVAYSFIFAVFAIGVPHVAGALVGHQVSLAIEHVASVLYISRSLVNTARAAGTTISNVGQTIGAAAAMQSVGNQPALQPPASAAAPSAQPVRSGSGSGATHAHTPPPTQAQSAARQTAIPLNANTRPVGGETKVL